jgi:hypothetical protein
LANDFGAIGDGKQLETVAMQKAIDLAAKVGGTVTLKPGTYLTGSLFLKSGVTLDLPEGVTLIGSEKLEDYPMLPTRIAGIEMSWPAALINVRDQHNVTITGKGTIDGDGPIWWKSYWDLRATYEPKGLRWASDYDARRPRLILIQNSSEVQLGGGILLKRSGFWTVQILYSHDVHLDGVIIRNNEGGKGPSTDGIDIDSSRKDSGGARRHRRQRRCALPQGGPRLRWPAREPANGRYCFARLDHSPRRGGYHHRQRDLGRLSQHRSLQPHRAQRRSFGRALQVGAHTGRNGDDIRIHDLTLTGVAIPIHITMNWNPSYSYATLPPGLKDIPPYWVVLTTKVDEQKGLPHFSDVHIWNIKATGAKSAFNVSAYPNATLDDFRIDHLDIEAATAGTVANAKNWKLTENQIKTADGSKVVFTDSAGNNSSDIPYGEPK